MSTTNLDHHDLSEALAGGLMRESVMERIWLIDQFELPIFDRCARDTTGNRYYEWTIDELGAATGPATPNAKVDGADVTTDESSIGTREGAHCQIMTKLVIVSHRANNANSIGRQGSLSYQVMRAQQRLRRDIEAHFMSDVAAVKGTDSVAGVTAGVFSWIKTNTVFGATGSDGGFNTTTLVTDAPTAGTKAALDESEIRDVAQNVYEEGGSTDCLIGNPTIIRALSEYLFTSSAKVATQTNYKQGEGKDQSSTAYGAVTVFVTDFGQVLKLIPNRLMPVSAGGAAESHLLFLDPRGVRCAMLQGFQTRPLARTGLAEKRLVSADLALAVTNEKMQGAIRDLDDTAAVIA